MRQLFISFLIVCSANSWANPDSGSGEQLAHPPTVVLAEIWHYNQRVPVYRVDIKHAGESAELHAAEATVANLYPGFRRFGPGFEKNINLYVVARQDTGTHTTIYISRTIVADWLITS